MSAFDGMLLSEAVTLNALRVHKAGIRGLRGAAGRIGTLWKEDIQRGYRASTKSGKMYTHSDVGKTRAAPPGSPPAYQTGELHDSVEFRISAVPSRNEKGQFQKSGAMHISIFSDAEYAAKQEFGSDGPPRPLWRPVAKQMAANKTVTSLTKLYFTAAQVKAVGRMAPTIKVSTLMRRGAQLRMPTGGAKI